MPILEELDYYASDNNITVPPTWRTLEVVQLRSNLDRFGNPVFGMAVTAQTTLVTDDATRAFLIDDAFEVAWLQDAEVIHDSELTNDETGVSCWTHVRYGRARAGFDPEHRAVVLFAGPGIVSSGIIIWAPGSYTEIPTITGDLVESVCGTRPEGL